jgi:hypothetical protein
MSLNVTRNTGADLNDSDSEQLEARRAAEQALEQAALKLFGPEKEEVT